MFQVFTEKKAVLDLCLMCEVKGKVKNDTKFCFVVFYFSPGYQGIGIGVMMTVNM